MSFSIKKIILLALIFPLFLLFSLSIYAEPVSDSQHDKRVIFIDSYHSGYAWSAGVVAGARSILKPSGVEFKVFSMDTKRHQDEAFIKDSALKARAVIEQFNPDVIIACDDNASKYLIEPFYKNHSIPVVFCGINWDASVYGYPYKNATGMIEISMMAELVKELKRYAKGKTIGILAGNVISDRKSVKNYEDKAKVKFDRKIFVSDIKQWKQSYLQLQNEVDILIIENSMSITGWKAEDIYPLILKNTQVPTGSVQINMQPYVLIGFLQVPEEQGIYTAKTALRILAGESPENIPLVTNHQVIASVNLDLAEKLGIVFELEFLRNAKSFRWDANR